jgi:TIR domain
MTMGPSHAAAYVFLSYASADRERALHLADLLEARGVSVWIDRKSIAGGTSWSAEIVDGIKGCAVLLVLVTPAAVQSRNVHQEVQLAWEHERKLLPVLLERSQLPSAVEYALAGRQ